MNMLSLYNHSYNQFKHFNAPELFICCFFAGVSIITVDPHNIDAGKILLQKPYPIPLMSTFATLSERLSKIGAECLVDVIQNFDRYYSKALSQGEIVQRYKEAQFTKIPGKTYNLAHSEIEHNIDLNLLFSCMSQGKTTIKSNLDYTQLDATHSNSLQGSASFSTSTTAASHVVSTWPFPEAPKIHKSFSKLDFSTNSASSLFRRWQGLTGLLNTYVMFQNKRVNLLSMELHSLNNILKRIDGNQNSKDAIGKQKLLSLSAAGFVYIPSLKSILVKAETNHHQPDQIDKDAIIVLKELQMEGKGVMKAGDFASTFMKDASIDYQFM
jgi:methionyl-tRNA formyltransferase